MYNRCEQCFVMSRQQEYCHFGILATDRRELHWFLSESHTTDVELGMQPDLHKVST